LSRAIRADYEQQFLLPASLEDWVGEDHPARFIRDFVEALDLKALGFRVRRNREGRPYYAADLLLKVWLYGYLERIRSTRELEKACLDRMALVWLTGRNAPDHNTLWRFWRENRSALRKVFGRSVQVAAEAGLVGLVVHAVDGTKVTSAASHEAGWIREKLKRRLERVEASIEAMEREVEAREKQEQGEYRLPARLQNAQQRRQAIEQALRQLEAKDEKHHHPKDEGARLMRSPGGRPKWSYNAQAVADRDSGMVVAAEVTSEETDYRQLVPMLEKVEETLGEVAQETVADAGYRSAEQLGQAEEKGYEVLVSPHPDDRGEGKPFHVSHFRYDAERDCCICPRGEVLEYVSTERSTGKRVFYCQNHLRCPVRHECSRAKRGRKVKLNAHHEAIARQREKRQRADKQALLSQRKAIVERVFAWIKEGLGFRRWTVRGLEKVAAQWALICLTINLKRLLGYWRKGQLVLKPCQ
jgi:transposase